MRNPLAVVPEALEALKALSAAGQVEGLGPTITGLA